MRSKFVIKLGSLCVSDAESGLNFKKIENIVKEIVYLQSLGHDVIIVSSGAINSGRQFINHWSDQLQITRQQAASSVGQPLLMNAYIEAFRKYTLQPAQILVTHDDFKNKERFINVRNTILCLLGNGIIPIINENDTTSFEEITVGDNDQLAVMITLCVGANGLIILTEADGLYDKDPKIADAKKITQVSDLKILSNIQFGAKSKIGRGGMEKKLEAIITLFNLGVEVRVGTYLIKEPIRRLFSEVQTGTSFIPHKKIGLNHHKLWMQASVKNNAHISIDEGAFKALKNHKSLLPIGICKIKGKFKRGDVLKIKFKNSVVGVGLVEYGAIELTKIIGKNSEEILKIISHAPSKVAIHANNLFVVD